VYYKPARPFPAASAAAAGSGSPGADSAPAASPTASRDPCLLDLGDVTGRRTLQTSRAGRITIREANAAAALEVMSRFAIDPRWLIYLPPTMSPVATSVRPGLLEHPDQAFDAYRSEGVDAVVCEEKHMGSRAVALICRDADVARRRFGVAAAGTGAVWTRTGRSFFAPGLTDQLLARLCAAAEAAGLFDEFETGWLLLDAELMPWSVKAEDLLRTQYAAVGAAARIALPAALRALEQAAAAGLDVAALLERTRARDVNAAAFRAAYRRYCWPAHGLDGVRIAPFQLLATDGSTYSDRPHSWHLAIADRLVDADPRLVAPTRRIFADTTDPASTAAATSWWEKMTAAGGEGMVVKPAANLVRGRRGLVQPGLKVRGPEYLRIIYGPDYAEPANLTRLRTRGLGHKRSLAWREYALGLEALDRTVSGEPLWRIHECVFAVLALESEPVDPRL
jgi:protein phosphatase